MKTRCKKKNFECSKPVAPVEMPGLDSHLCFALLRRQQSHDTSVRALPTKARRDLPRNIWFFVVLWERGPAGRRRPRLIGCIWSSALFSDVEAY